MGKAKVRPLRPAKKGPVHPFDTAHGTDTGGLIPGAALVTGHASDAQVTAYYAVAPSILDGLIDVWLGTQPPHDIESYTFLDVGAGKGRAIMTACQHPFKQVVGIELNPGLASIARANLTAFLQSDEAMPLTSVEMIEGDALEVPLPSGPALVFLFHPFEQPMVKLFVARLKRHFGQAKQSFDLAYVNAEYASGLDRDQDLVRLFNGMIPMSPEDHLADLAEIAEQAEYGSTGDEFCTIHRFTVTG